MKLEELFNYKNKLMRDLCCNENIVKLITNRPDPEVPNHTLPYSQVFPYEFVPETISHGQTIICFDVDIIKVPNKTFYYPVLYLWLFTHKSNMQIDEGGVRMDALASEIDAMLNGNRNYGLGQLELDSLGRFSPILDYQGRVMTYTARDFNRAAPLPVPNRRRP